eukprot:10604061-Lingulodinium_polyedra.AAC.1
MANPATARHNATLSGSQSQPRPQRSRGHSHSHGHSDSHSHSHSHSRITVCRSVARHSQIHRAAQSQSQRSTVT